MFETFTITQTFSVFLGLYLLSIGVGILLERDTMQTIIQQFSDSAALTFIGGILAFLVGAIIVSLHQDYSSTHGTVVSIIGWMILVKGVLILSFRGLFLRIASNFFISPKLTMGVSIFAILAGVWMMSAI